MKKKLLPVIMSIALFASQTAVIAENTYEYVIVEEPGTEASEYNGFTDDIQDDVIESEDIFYDGNSECDIVDEIPSDENEEVIQEETDFSDIESVVSEDTEAIETEAEEIVEDDVFEDDEEIVEEEWENVDENDDEIVGDDDDKIEISIYQFPDPNFRKYVSDDIDADRDGYLSKQEREKVTKLVFDEIIYDNYGFTGKIISLRGLDVFTNLQSLTCEYTDLILLDMSKNTALKELRISNNSILSLNLTNNKELECIEL